ncbi:NEP1-interacting protein 1 isoform X1 [Cajanus cajan]|uniref:RING-H2 finger protein ATL4M n=1 Tax=Cajanus cajan TaxID=3821 RepID=A0A151U283_CAJCA|nr:NEP1-interacting protein 1 isoform X1 [Cajanus cajan]KYP73405.1 RING-H2 finger protein ATL4M [Cajanus cajan]
MSITNTSLTMTNWFSGMTKTVTRCKQLFSLFAVIGGSVAELFMKAMDRVLFAAFTCILALGGSIVGSIAGGIKGQTTEAGFLDGAGKGAITGAIASLELINFASLDEPLSKVALLRSLLNGKVFMEWICPAVAQLYQLHATISTLETIFEEVSDIYDIRGLRGIPQNVIMKLPFQPFNSNKMLKSYNTSCCSICYQDFEDGELVRILPKCSHHFHLECIDKWLVQQGSCPMCRTYVPDHIRN